MGYLIMIFLVVSILRFRIARIFSDYTYRTRIASRFGPDERCPKVTFYEEPSMSSTGFVTRLAQRLGDELPNVRDEAARQLWELYSPRLLRRARTALAHWLRRRVDEEDVLQSMFKSLFQDFQAGNCSVKDRQELWRLLVRYTMGKIANACERHTAQRRDVRREQHDHADDDLNSSNPRQILDNVARSEPTPAETALAKDEFERRLRMLPADLRQVVLWKLDGYSNDDIARFLGRTRRTVEMKFNRVRDKWATQELP
jgi:RNA polymerase sigma-70 factor (ECF subfamily)